jgi:4-amino-4-deoxy-L-arabinose transferase-like glycosyltransferase
MSFPDSTLTSPPSVIVRAPVPARVHTLALVWIALLAVFGWRIAWDATHQIVSDEAVYWTWSRHPAAGYLDHPPMVAYLIGLSTKLLGSTPLGVRFFAAALACGSVGIIIALAARLLRDPRQAAWCGGLLMLSPLVVVLGSIITPDTPAIFFSCCALACAVAAVDSPDAHGLAPRPRGQAPLLWLAFGGFVGLALLTKYTAVLLPASVVGALLTSRTGRDHLRRPWIYLSAVIALLIFAPVLYWNWRHGWVSFRFQLSHGLGEHPDADAAEPVHGTGRLVTSLAQLGEYVGGQAAVWNPVLMVLGVVAVAGLVRRYATLPASRQVLLWCAAVPLLFFGAASLKSKGEMNWPAFAYFPLTLLTVEYVFAGPAAAQAVWRRKWLGTGLWVAAIGAVVISMPSLLVRAGVRLSKFDELSGWPAFARQLEVKRAGLPVVCNMQRDAGQVAFHLPGQPDVRAISVGSRPTAFDYMDDRLDPRSMPRLVFMGGHVEAFCADYGFAPVRKDSVKVPLESGRQRARQIVILERLPKESAVPAHR